MYQLSYLVAFHRIARALPVDSFRNKMIKTVNVTVIVNDQNGLAVSGALISARLDSPEISSGYVLPHKVDAVANASGVAVLALWPNQLGATQSQYEIKIKNPKTQKTTQLVATIPDIDCFLHAVANLPAYTGKIEGQIALDAAIALVAEINADASAIAASTASATASKNAAALSASSASTDAASALESKNSAASKAAEADASAIAAAVSAAQAAAGDLVTSVAGRQGAIVLTKADVALSLVDNTADASKPVSADQAAANTATLNSAKSYANSLVVGLWDDRGNYNASGGTYPATGGSGAAGAVIKGDIWTVALSGIINTVQVDPQQTLRALIDAPGQISANWAISGGNAALDDAIVDNVVGRAPSQNAVFKALGLKAPLLSPSFTGAVVNKFTLTAPTTSATINTRADNLTHSLPAASGNLALEQLQQNSQSATYVTVLSDAGKQLYHPSADTTARNWTIASNASVSYPVGTGITFVNDTGAGALTISIASDTLKLAGAGTTGSRTLAANGIATALKITATSWIISGAGLT
jgi:hypothetical protein